MRPTFMGLETAKRGLMVNQKALDIIGNNISNINTKGYTRQRLDTVSVQVYGSDRFQYSSIPLAGQGVDASGVSQIRNPYLDTKFREQYSDVGYFDQKAAVMEQMEGILSDPEVEGTGIKDALTVLSQALADFSQHPYQETNANIVLNAFKGITQVLNEYDTNLKSLEEMTKNDLSIAVDDINTKLKQLSDLNKSIAHEIFVNDDYDGVNYGPNDLLDQRNTILDDLSRYGKLEVISLDQGRIQVKLGGKLVVDANGGNYSNDAVRIGLDGTSLSWGDGTTANLGAGAIRGFEDMLTGNNSTQEFPTMSANWTISRRPWQMYLTAWFTRMIRISRDRLRRLSRGILMERSAPAISGSVICGQRIPPILSEKRIRMEISIMRIFSP